MVVAAAGRPRCRAWLHRVTRDGAACSKKNCLKPWQRVGDSSSRERRLRRSEGARCLSPSRRLPRGLHGRNAPTGETRQSIAMAPGRPARNDYEYRRCGTCNVFTEPLAGKRMTKVTERKIDWAQFLADIAGRYQDATTITLVMDNLNTPRRPLRGLPAGRGQGPVGPLRVRLHPQARQLAERGGTQRHDPPEPPHRLHRGVTPGSCRLAGDRIQAKVDWQFTTDDARVKLKRLYPTFDE